MYRDFEEEDKSTVLAFGCGCVLTFAGVKLLTSNRSSKMEAHNGLPPLDDKRAPMLGADSYSDPRVIVSAAPLGVGDGDGSTSAPGLSIPFDEEYEQLQPVTLLNSPLAVSGDVLRRTFSTRLSAFAERAAQLGASCRGGSCGGIDGTHSSYGGAAAGPRDRNAQSSRSASL